MTSAVVSKTVTVNLNGAYYTIDSFYVALLAAIGTADGVTWGKDDDILEDRGLYNLKVASVAGGTTYTDAVVTYNGYNLLEMLGMSITPLTVHSETYSLSIGVGTPAVAVKRFYMPIVKQFNVTSDLQVGGTLYFDQDSK